MSAYSSYLMLSLKMGRRDVCCRNGMVTISPLEHVMSLAISDQRQSKSDILLLLAWNDRPDARYMEILRRVATRYLRNLMIYL